MGQWRRFKVLKVDREVRLSTVIAYDSSSALDRVTYPAIPGYNGNLACHCFGGCIVLEVTATFPQDGSSSIKSNKVLLDRSCGIASAPLSLN